MSTNSLSIEITVLGIKKINDIHNKLDFISPIKGLDFCLIRERSKTNPLPDLFDTSLVTFNQKSKNNEIKFIKGAFGFENFGLCAFNDLFTTTAQSF